MSAIASRVKTNGGIRLRPPSRFAGPQWIAEDLPRRERFALSPVALLLVVACFQPQEPDAVVADVAQRLALEPADVEQVLGALQRSGVVTQHGAEQQASWAEALRGLWARHGWLHAADYHLLTYDFPFLDYSAGDAVRTDHELMAHYAVTQPDIERVKSYPLAHARVACPAPDAVLAALPLDRVLRADGVSRALTLDVLLAITSLACGKTGAIHGAVQSSAPLMYRTSPSGGARHPIETYVLVRGIRDLSEGWYHVAVDPPALEYIAAADAATVAGLRTQLGLAPPDAAAAYIVLTAVFERNMYRYREPRTFRSVHIDAGHLAASIELLGAQFGLTVTVAPCVSVPAIENALALEVRSEGLMALLALEGADRTEPPLASAEGERYRE